MIVKATPELMPRELGSPDANRKIPDEGGGPSEFAELMKGPNRTERTENTKPGRESEGKRSEESEAVTPLNTKKLARKNSEPAQKKRAKTTEGDDIAPSAVANAAVARQAPEAKPEVEDDIDIEVVESPKVVRESAMADFLTKMQNDVGIEPEQIVEAFSKLSDNALMASPEESAKDFLAALNLPEEKRPIAKDLYSQMVAKTGDADLEEKIEALDDAIATLDASLEVVSDYELDQLGPAGQALKDLSDAADDLVAEASLPALAPVALEKHEAQRAADDMQAQLARLMQPTMAPVADVAAPATEADVEALPVLETPALVLDDVAAEPATPTPSASESLDASSTVSSNAALAASMVATKAEAEAESSSNDGFKKPEEKVAAKSAPKVEKRTSVEPEFRLDDGTKFDTVTSAPPQTTTSTTTPLASTSAPTAILDRPMTSEEEAANAKQILNQARLAIKNGGGEVEMVMNPEGVGRVRLKVTVDDGQTDIRLVAENESTKKMLEKGLGDLKSSLAEHQIKVENLKVDVGSEIKKHMDQNQDHASRQQSWQAAQDFLGRFRDERNGFRRNFMETQGARRNYGGGSRPEMTPAPAVRASSGTSKRLNVVA